MALFLSVLRFELRYWLKGMMVWIFLLILGTLVFGATATDQVTIGGSTGNVHKNAPYVIQIYYSIMGVFAMLMTTAFVNSAASRDFQYNTYQIVFTTPLGKAGYLGGRFLGSTLVACLPFLGITIGMILAGFMPWVDHNRFGPISWGAHFHSFFTFAVPNTFFIAAIVFVIAVLTRSTLASFLGVLLLLVAYTVSDILTEDLDNEKLAMLIDPLGARTYSILTKYWTSAERNARYLSWENMLLANRAIWVSLGALAFAFGYRRFSFAERATSKKAAPAPEETSTSNTAIAIPVADTSRPSLWAQFAALCRFETKGMVKTTSFIVILAAALLNAVPSIIISSKEGYGNSSYPVTYFILEVIQGSFYTFCVAMIVYYSGLLVWRERDARMDEIEDAAPTPAWLRYAAKFVSLLAVMAILQALMLLVGVTTQAALGYYRFQLGLYFTELFIYDFSFFYFLAVLAFFVHVLSPNKYAGYFGVVAFLVVNAFVWEPLNVGTQIVRYPHRPNYTYSDFFGYAPYLYSWWVFTLYWAIFASLLMVLTMTLWPRGKETAVAFRWRSTWRGGLRSATIGMALTFAAGAAWLYYNTSIVNEIIGPKTALDRQADYERKYKKFQHLPQPRITAVQYEIDLYPERRAMRMRATQDIVNKTAAPLTELHLLIQRGYKYEVEIPGATVSADDKPLSYRIYKLDPPMQPGEKRTMRFKVDGEPRGVASNFGGVRVSQNGTFFNSDIAPQIGYQAGREISSRNERRKRGLPDPEPMPELVRDCTAKCMDTYISNNSDWVNVETVISTSPDQIAIAPGSLTKEWTKDDRRYFAYKLDRASLNFYSFMSARYEVRRSEWNGVKTEVYYHHEHPWNVDKMMNAIHRTLDYATKNFGPYAHKQARIIEFPRVASFAQAFPGTMPYSEAIGFVARLEKPDDIDMVHYVVAHEMAHQWWAHQVVGANMQGATVLSESLAQYTALMVMEHKYGRDQMRKFLEYEVDRYLSGRGRERLKERPLLKVEAGQGYIHYQKASAAIYYLKEMIGEEAINRALRKVVAKYAYAEPPFPTSHVLVDALREETPEELRYLITDLFEEITLFANRTMDASVKKRPDGQYDVKIAVEAKKLRADAEGNEKEVALNDFVEIGAIAKAEKGKRYGKILHRQRVKLTTAGRHEFTFVTKELPEKAGIDPLRLLIDRVPGDNMKSVSE